MTTSSVDADRPRSVRSALTRFQIECSGPRQTECSGLHPRGPSSGGALCPTDLVGRYFADMCHPTMPQRRGTALILVVAVLGILFVAGAALLNQVTFSTSTLQAAREARQTDAAIDAIEDMALGWLANGFIGPDGQALNPQSRLVAHKAGDPNAACDGADDCVLALPQYSEVPGIHPIDLNEPVNSDVTGFGADLRFKLFSNPVFASNNKPGVDPKFAGNTNLVGARVDVAQPIAGVWDADDNGRFEYPRDADGDGIVDSFQFLLPDGVLPPEIQRELADRLRDPNYNLSDPDRDPDQIWISLKIVPHGAMIDLNKASETVLRWFLLDQFFTKPMETYAPQTNEWYLRHRGLMLPRTLPQTPLLQDYAAYLLPQHEWPRGGGAQPMTILANSGMREWWGYDFKTDAAGVGSLWTEMMNSTNINSYDLVHNVTTISHDDQLMRPVRNASGQDMIEAMRAVDGAGPWNSLTDVFALDNYPPKLDVSSPNPDPRLGRLKVSFNELTDMLTGVGLKNLSQFPAARKRIVGTIQQTYLLMLSNHRDFNRDRTVNAADEYHRAVTAAMLTANTIDFADRDDSGITGDLNGEPFEVEVVGTNGLPVTPPLKVFGFERQPFITEVFAQLAPGPPGLFDETQSSFAIELYNPYNTEIFLANYRLEDVGAPTSHNFVGGGSTGPIGEDLSSLQNVDRISPGGFLVVFAEGGFAAPTSIDPASDDEGTGSAWSVDEKSVIRLVRRVTSPTLGPVNIVVDEFNVAADVAAVTGSSPQSFPISTTGLTWTSWERDNGTWGGGPDSRWRFVVPRANEFVKDATPHTLGTSNRFDDTVTFGVHVDVANLVNFEDAYPTTGSMLLIPRTAHVYDPTGMLTSPFNRVNQAVLPRNIQTDHDRMENGRIPVFDLAVDNTQGSARPQFRDASDYGVTPGQIQGIEALPWGQLLFDYFTGLPLENCDPAAGPTCGNNQIWPKVDQEGLRVHGRININAASAAVIASAPMVKLDLFKLFPDEFRGDISDALYGNRNAGMTLERSLGIDAANAIVWYREGMNASNKQGSLNFETQRDPYNTSPVGASGDLYVPRQGYGFLTVGELLNVISTSPGSDPKDPFGLDSGTYERALITANNQQSVYDRAVGRMVALGDWFTTRSHVFTVYGVIRGQFNDDPDPVELEKSLRATDQRAIRFQTTVDRLPMFFGRSQPERIGARVAGGYADVRAE